MKKIIVLSLMVLTRSQPLRAVELKEIQSWHGNLQSRFSAAPKTQKNAFPVMIQNRSVPFRVESGKRDVLSGPGCAWAFLVGVPAGTVGFVKGMGLLDVLYSTDSGRYGGKQFVAGCLGGIVLGTAAAVIAGAAAYGIAEHITRKGN